jgi:hypothetical protein
VRAGRVLTFYKWEGRGSAHTEAEPGSGGNRAGQGELRLDQMGFSRSKRVGAD